MRALLSGLMLAILSVSASSQMVTVNAMVNGQESVAFANKVQKWTEGRFPADLAMRLKNQGATIVARVQIDDGPPRSDGRPTAGAVVRLELCDSTGVVLADADTMPPAVPSSSQEDARDRALLFVLMDLNESTRIGRFQKQLYPCWPYCPANPH